MATSSWAQLLSVAFPKLASEGFEIVGEPTTEYNCIAYAAGDTGDWWWPDEDSYWPPWATPDDSTESLQEAFAGIGYELCDDSHFEEAYLKVALYADDGKFQHAAAQTPDGAWRSKMGRGPLIEHRSAESLSGGPYGEVYCFMRRPL